MAILPRFFSRATAAAAAATRRTTTSSSSRSTPIVSLFLNASRLDYDNRLDFSRIESLTNFVRNDTDYVKDPKRILDLVHTHKPDIVVTKEMELPAAVFDEFPDSVKLLCEAGTGYNNLPVSNARERNVMVCNIPTYSTEAVAHMAITFLLNLSIDMIRQQIMLHEDNRANFTGPFTLPLGEVNGKTVGLIGGSGLIGSKVADVALSLGMDVIISSRSGSLPSSHRHANNSRVKVVENVEILLRESDYVSVHCPLNDETRGSIGRSMIEQMKPTAYFINCARGAICNEPELIECLKENVIAGAGLDVTVGEPPEMDSELWTLPNVILTPHIGWRRIETRQRLVDMTADNIEAYIASTVDPSAKMINVVN